MPRVNVGLATYTTGPGVMGEVGWGSPRWSVSGQFGRYLNLAEQNGEQMFEPAGDATSALLVAVRPGADRVEIALGAGRVDGHRYRTYGGGGETWVDRVDVGGGAVFAQLGWAPRQRFGVGVRAMVVASRHLTGVGAAITLGAH